MLQFDYVKSKLLKQIIVGIHIVAWLVFFQISFDLGGLYYALTDLIYEDQFYYFDEAFIFIPFLLILFYWNSQYLIPKFVTPKHWLKYILYLVISYIVCIVLNILMYDLITELGWRIRADIEEFEDIIFTLYLVIILASLARGITKLALDNANQAKEAKEKYKEAELNYLQAQINPHFIFNTLNTLYSLSEQEEASQTTEAILKFSELMRYPIHEGHQDYVSLNRELEFIDNFIELQKLKLGEDYPIVFEKDGDFSKMNIIPLCLIPIVENAFKYGVSQRLKTKLQFKVYTKEKNVYFESENQINPSIHVESHQIGIENLQQRLNLSYPGKSKLILNRDQNKFKVKLILPGMN